MGLLSTPPVGPLGRGLVGHCTCGHPLNPPMGPRLELNLEPAVHSARHALLHMAPKWSSHQTTWAGLTNTITADIFMVPLPGIEPMSFSLQSTALPLGHHNVCSLALQAENQMNEACMPCVQCRRRRQTCIHIRKTSVPSRHCRL